MTAAANSPALRLAIISEGINAWPLYVASERKLFEGNGVRVDVTLTGSSVYQLEQLKSGGFDVGFQQSDHVVRAVEGGSDLCIVMAQGHAPELSLVTAPGITRFADLQGRDIAVDGANTGYALLLRKLLAGNGLKKADYRLVEIGGSQERFDALKSGRAAASWLNPPFDRNLMAAGFGSLGTSMRFFPAYPGAIAAARRSWAAQNAERLVAFIRGFRLACQWLREPAHKAEAIALLPQRLQIDAELAGRAFDACVRRPLPVIDAAGLQQVIDVYWEAEGLRTPQGAPSRYMDLSYQQRAGI